MRRSVTAFARSRLPSPARFRHAAAMNSIARCIAAFLLMLTLVGCRSFDKEWARVRARPPAASGMAGTWTGTWQNTNNTHGGALRAIITPAGTDGYQARFHATWGNHKGSFTTRLKATREVDALVFEGRKRILGFLIVTRGRGDAKDLSSTYESRFDSGTFTLRRPE